jgi:hypothetical protein
MHLHDPARQRQTDTETWRLEARARPSTKEWLEYLRQLIRGDATAVVSHAYNSLIRMTT